ncbi:hypothetical protein BZG36_02780 [Bifiguratus adelaidae]|uniref:Uncharacterized protein n=1 Tax=Bifiguratus adelaidae TaxID=1938954 RepID=A0A261Y1Z9_9FUNG|nr:hypothetical protein BZG36_02780 [Bifiguratus adelaidae]
MNAPSSNANASFDLFDLQTSPKSPPQPAAAPMAPSTPKAQDPFADLGGFGMSSPPAATSTQPKSATTTNG